MQRVIPHICESRQLYGKTILITGGTGMILSTVVDALLYLNKTDCANIRILLAARSKQRVITRFQDFVEGQDYWYIEYDALSTKGLDIEGNVDYMIHGASNANPLLYTKQPVETMMSNIIGLKVLLDLALKKGSRLMYISSSEIYGTKCDDKPYKETDYGFIDILNARACYPNAKRIAETLCVGYNAEFGVDVVIGRPGYIYGPTISKTDTRASAEFSRCAAIGQNIIMKSLGTQLRSYCYIMDCASAVLSILIKGKTNEAYNISNPDSICSVRDIAEELAQAANVKVVFETPSESEKKGYSLMNNSILESTKLQSLGWNAEFSLEEGCKKTIEGLRG